MRILRLLFPVLLFCLHLLAATSEPRRVDLRSNWQLVSSCKVRSSGDEITKPGYSPTGWYSASVPSTVLSAQLAAGEFKDPNFGMNLRDIPGTTYAIGEEFSRMPIPADSPYACSWWYRTEFVTPPNHGGVSLHFDGINYKANIWLNGRQIAGTDDVAGAYRTYDFDIASSLTSDGKNILAIETFAPSEKELGINWVDWNPAPPDKDMGLIGDVYMNVGGAAELQYPTVNTHFTNDDLSQADLTVVAEIHNRSSKPVHGIFHFAIDGLRVAGDKEVDLADGERRQIILTPGDLPQLHVTGATPWWPAQMGDPHLYVLRSSITIDGAASDLKQTKFGIREITTERTPKGALLFHVNGKRLLIRGGGWAQDMNLRRNTERLKAQFDYVRDMNLNTIRLEGKLESDEFFDLADDRGILVMAGWCCCDIWEQWDKWNEGQLAVATASVRSQMLRLRAHPSLLVWLNGSDNAPPAPVMSAYLAEEKRAAWPNPVLTSASDTGAGVKMTGPYDYVPPAYWMLDKNQRGGAYGFNTETSPGAAIPTSNSLEKFIPRDHLWPPNEFWTYHAGSEGFKDLHLFNEAMNASYGPPVSLDDFQLKSQAMAYDGERAMFEAYSRNKYTSTGVIQWMLNNAWPSFIWHLYDYYLQPAGGYFGAKKANEPVHILYSYDDGSVAVVNSTYKPVAGLTASVRAFDVHLKELFSNDSRVDIGPDAVQQVFSVPDLSQSSVSPTYFVQLQLSDTSGKIVSRNFYWLSTKAPAFDWAKTTYISTPISSHVDLMDLQKLPRAAVQTFAWLSKNPASETLHVNVKNNSHQLAFQIRLAAQDRNGDEVLPVLWEDNYISLMPGEERSITATFPSGIPKGLAHITFSGWNLSTGKIAIGAARPVAKQVPKETHPAR